MPYFDSSHRITCITLFILLLSASNCYQITLLKEQSALKNIVYQPIRQQKIITSAFNNQTNTKESKPENRPLPYVRKEEGGVLLGSAQEISFLFPYRIYRYLSTNNFKNNYIFRKIPYDEVSSHFKESPRTIKSIDQYQHLYDHLPNYVHIQSEEKQYLDFQLVSGEGNDYYFTIKNTTMSTSDEDLKWGKTRQQVNLHQISIHNYLFYASHNQAHSLENQNQSQIPQNRTQEQFKVLSEGEQEKLSNLQKIVYFQQYLQHNLAESLMKFPSYRTMQLEKMITHQIEINLNSSEGLNPQWKIMFNGTYSHAMSIHQTECVENNITDQTPLQEQTSATKDVLSSAGFNQNKNKFKNNQCINILYQATGLMKKPPYFVFSERKQSLNLEGPVFFGMLGSEDSLRFYLGSSEGYYMMSMKNNEWTLLERVYSNPGQKITEMMLLKGDSLMRLQSIMRLQEQQNPSYMLLSNISSLVVYPLVTTKKLAAIVTVVSSSEICRLEIAQDVLHTHKLQNRFLIICVEHLTCRIIDSNCKEVDKIVSEADTVNIVWSIRKVYRVWGIEEYITGTSSFDLQWSYMKLIDTIPLLYQMQMSSPTTVADQNKTVSNSSIINDSENKNNSTLTNYLNKTIMRYGESIFDFSTYKDLFKYQGHKIDVIAWEIIKPKLVAYFKNLTLQKNQNLSSYKYLKDLQSVFSRQQYQIQRSNKRQYQLKNNTQKDSQNVTLSSSSAPNLQSCYIEENKKSNLSLNRVIILNESLSVKWELCNVSFETSTVLMMEFDFSQSLHLYDIVYCSIRSKYMRNLDQNFHCSQIENVKIDGKSHQKISVYMLSNLYYKIYFVKKQKNVHKTNKTTNISEKTIQNVIKIQLIDIEQEQIEMVTSIFFIVMITLTSILCLLICIILIRPIFISLLIYYDWMEVHANDTYPLSYLNLKIKLKKLTKKGFLKYKKKVVKSQGFTHTEGGSQTQIPGEEELCCFCISAICNGEKAAELYCRHEFHAECFNAWAKNQPNTKCPSCRRPFTLQSLQQFKSSQVQFKLSDVGE